MRFKLPAAWSIGIDINPEVVAAFACAAGGEDHIDCADFLRHGFLMTSASPLKIERAHAATSDDGRRRPKLELAAVDGIAFLESYDWKGDEFVYCDPPYLLSTRSRKRIYLHELTERDHKRLLGILKTIPAAVAIAGYWSKLYARELKQWRFITYQAMTRGGTSRSEYLWMNYPEPTALHDYRYLGSNRTERQRIKRKCARWEAKLVKMPLLERQALLATIEKLYSKPS